MRELFYEPSVSAGTVIGFMIIVLSAIILLFTLLSRFVDYREGFPTRIVKSIWVFAFSLSIIGLIAGSITMWSAPPRTEVFSPPLVNEYVQDRYHTDLERNGGGFFGAFEHDEYVGDNAESCLTDEQCEGFILEHQGTDFWVKYDEDKGAVYLYEPQEKIRLDENDAQPVSEKRIESLVKKQSRLENVEVTVSNEDAEDAWEYDARTPQDTPVTVSGVLDGVYLDDLLVVLDEDDHVRVIPEGETTKSVSEDDLAK